VADSDLDGASFYPTVGFTSGETVTVSTNRHICGTSGDSSKFRVALPAASLATAPSAAPSPTPALDQPTTTYISMPGVKVPKLKVTVPSSLGGGYIFESPQGGTKLGGPMIVNGKGQVVWFTPLPPEVVAADFRVQTYQGKPVLTYWEGRIINGHGVDGEDIIMNSAYQVIRVIKPGNGYTPDLHEFLLSSSGSIAWLTAFNTVGWNLKPEGGPKNGAVLDGIVQELDVATGNVLFEWHSLDHVPVQLSSVAYADTSAYDYFHVNAIVPLATGTILVSSRNTSTVYAIALPTGEVLWRLGGKQSSFKMGSGASFALQHNPQMHGASTISIFDDEDNPPADAAARAILLKLNFKSRSATLERAYGHKGLLVPAQGNIQILANGDVLIGWGSGHYTSEYSSSGKLLFDGYFGTSVSSYRAYLYKWVGTPAAPPSIATAKDGSGGLTVYASWNGSTQTRKWEVLGGPNATDLTPLATVKRGGFQTDIHLTTTPAAIKVVAEAADGHALGSSAVISPSSAG
jgi:outer membrane protein assembly factor BamB